MAAFESVMNSDYPEEMIFDTSPGSLEGRIATLKANTPIHEHGRIPFSFRILKFESPIQSVRAFRDDGLSKWVDVVIPGFGRGQVLRTALLFDEINNSRNQFATGITTLTMRFGFMVPIEGAVPSLLELIGSSFQNLKVDGASEELDKELLIADCPNLFELSIRKKYKAVRLNFRENHANCEPLPDLRFDGYDVEEIANELCDRNGPGTKCMRQPRVSRLNRDEFGTIIYDPRIKDVLDSLLRMLEVNTTLEYFQVILSSTFHNFEKHFKRHHLQPIDQTVQLLIENKAAFLSVVLAQDAKGKMKKNILS